MTIAAESLNLKLLRAGSNSLVLPSLPATIDPPLVSVIRRSSWSR